MKLYCGIDLSNQSTALCVVDEEGQMVAESEIVTEEEELRKFFGKFKGLSCVVEATALAEWMCGIVEKTGHRINIIDPRQAKAVTHTKKKTDKVDACKLAQLSRVGWYTVVHRKSGKARGLRSFMTARNQLVKTQIALKSAIQGLFRSHGTKLPSGSGDVFERNVRLALKQADPLLKRAITPLLKTWVDVSQRAAAMYVVLDRQIAKKDPECELLMSVPSIGPATAATFIATVDDPKRFATGEQVSSYIGLVPSIYQSGETEIRGRITKQGDALLRWLLVEAASNLLCHSKSTCALRQWGQRIQKEKGFGKARVAVARKLAVIMHRIWLTGEEFDERIVSAAAC